MPVDTADFNVDGNTDILFFNPTSRQTLVRYLNNNISITQAFGPTIASGYILIGSVEFNADGHPDLLLFNPSSRRTAFWKLNNTSFAGGVFGPVIPPGYGSE